MVNNTLTLAVQTKIIVGLVKDILIYPGKLLIHAKMDTRAETSSLGYDSMSVFKCNGENGSSLP